MWMQILDFTLPRGGRSPLMVEVPHAGLAIPEAVQSELVVDSFSVQRDADLYVDKLYAYAPEAGASLLAARVSRYVVDLNRSAEDVDPLTVPDHPHPRTGQPRGVVWRVTTEGVPALRKPLDYAGLQRRLSSFHAPYHNKLQEELNTMRERFGFAMLLAGHSMPSSGRRAHRDPGNRRADVVPGTLGGTSADRRLIDLVDSHFRSAGLSVRHDDPYRGGWTTAHYGRPAEGVHVVQIELNRALYMHESNCEPKHGDFERLQLLLRELVQKVATLKLA